MGFRVQFFPIPIRNATSLTERCQKYSCIIRGSECLCRKFVGWGRRYQSLFINCLSSYPWRFLQEYAPSFAATCYYLGDDLKLPYPPPPHPHDKACRYREVTHFCVMRVRLVKNIFHSAPPDCQRHHMEIKKNLYETLSTCSILQTKPSVPGRVVALRAAAE